MRTAVPGAFDHISPLKGSHMRFSPLLAALSAACPFVVFTGSALAQTEIPDFRIRAALRTPANGAWGEDESLGNAEFRIQSRFLHVYYGGVSRNDDYRFTIGLDFTAISGFSSEFASSPYNTDYDVYIENAFIGRLDMNASSLGQGSLEYDSRHATPPALPIPENFPEIVNTSDVIRFYAAAAALPAIGDPRPAGQALIESAFEERYARGDANQDGHVDMDDYAYLAASYDPFHLLGEHFGPGAGDFTGDNLCDQADYGVLVENWDSHDDVPAEPAPIAVPCYANCDSSAVAPVLNVLDFNCFLNRFSAGDAYANCDGSAVAPVLNVLDFNCFLNRFSAGCP
jgi:hypothetical protein